MHVEDVDRETGRHAYKIHVTNYARTVKGIDRRRTEKSTTDVRWDLSAKRGQWVWQGAHERVEIRGEVERPDVFYIIPRREVPMDLGSRSKNYREEIMAPLLPGRFEDWVRTTRAKVIR